MRIAFDHIFLDSEHDVQCLKCLTFNVGLISKTYYCLGCGEKIKPPLNPDGGVAEVIDFQELKNRKEKRKEKRKEEENVR